MSATPLLVRVVGDAAARQQILSRIAAEGLEARIAIAREGEDADAVVLVVPPEVDPADPVRRELEATDAPVIALFATGAPPEALAAAAEAGAAECICGAKPLGFAVASAVAAGRGARLRGALRTLERALDDGERIRAAALSDPLTGLQNKRCFEARLEEEENKAYRTGLPVSLVLVDLDHFKSLNDTYGHAFGDRVLREVGAVIRRCTRNYDITCRYGGEEFAAILPSTRASAAQQVAE
ncbi:MAG TPA: diguanylate cyclase, partial [Planctomycetota bacterium]|nr:diguanylate cyclase [Planctomycetota bacterium]